MKTKSMLFTVVLTVTGLATALAQSPLITAQPTSRTNDAATTATFNVTAIGTEPLSYQWYKGTNALSDGGNVSGATTVSLTLATVFKAEEGSYWVVVTNVYGSATGGPATLTLIEPVIATEPADQFVPIGSNATFTVVGIGTAPLYYQWRLDGTNIAEATDASLVISNVSLDNDGEVYSVVVSNAYGSVTSAGATLTIIFPPTIVTEPESDIVTAGSSVSFWVEAEGTLPLSYQWKFNGTNIAGATESSYSITNVQPADAGTYSVVVTNIAGSATSANATLTVHSPPSITGQPTNKTVIIGQNATFTVTATGSGSLKYQWRFNGTNVAGATRTSYTVTNAQPTNAGDYSVRVTNLFGTAISSNATLTVLVPPAITTQPQDLTVTQGFSATFSVTASGTLPFSYQWHFNGTNIGGATDSSYTRNDAQTNDAGTYSVTVTNVAGSVTSSNATLTVLVPPTVTTQPQSLTVNAGSNATFTVTAAGTMPLGYQWRKNGAELSGQTTNSLVLGGVLNADEGSYDVVVTNVAGGVTSAVATLTVNDPIIVTQPVSRTNNAGTEAMFTVVAGGTPPFSYQWKKDGGDLSDGGSVSGAATAAVTISNVQQSDAGSYSVAVTGEDGTVSSAPATLTVIDPPTITTQPASRTNDAGTTATFTVVVIGTAPLSYQWKKEGVDLTEGGNVSGVTADTLTLSDVLNADEGSYSVVVTNTAGEAVSSNAVLTVIEPVISTQPTDQTVPVGSNTTFSIAAAGTTLQYQWRLNGTNIAGATAASLVVSNVSLADHNGVYSAVVSNSFGSVASSNATLTVVQAATITMPPASCFNAAGSTATFTVAATGTPPLSYQWYVGVAALSDGGNVSGATTPTLTLTGVATNDEAGYSVVVTNVYGSATGGPATLTVIYSPLITTQPANRTNIAGTTATFTVVVSGTAPFTYQWYKGAVALTDGSKVSGATTNVLTLSNVQDADAGSYSVIITNLAGSTNSAPATLTVVHQLPEVTSAVRSGSNVVFGGTGGIEGGAYYVLASTNVATRMTNWVRVATNTFGVGGTFSVTNAVDPAKRRQFFRLHVP